MAADTMEHAVFIPTTIRPDDAVILHVIAPPFGF
nr:MAG TPA: hypothetical protein [Caudoviricetes sp.]